MTPSAALPLRGLRVLDLTDGPVAACGRVLADLGADVVLVEPPEGVRSRRAEPVHQGVGLEFVTHHWNKRGAVLDLTTEAGRRDLLTLAGRADLMIESFGPGRLPVPAAELRRRNPALVIVSISDFGRSGPYRDRRGGDAVFMAMSSALSRSGAPGRPPLMPPGALLSETAGIQAALAALLAHLTALDTGRGDQVDCSVFEMAVQGLDPGFGMSGSATGGARPGRLPPGRPDVRHLYPIFPCADGHVRICLLAARQWRGMFGWLGEPAEFADPAFDRLGRRFAAAGTLYPLIGRLFADKTREELVEEGQRRGVPIAELNTPAEALDSDHLTGRGALADVEVAPGLIGRVPNGYVELDGVRAGFRHRAPLLGEHTTEIMAAEEERPERPVAGAAQHLPLAGVRVLDLGVIVAGAEAGRLLADQGAEVIKVENRAFPDGARQAPSGEAISAGFAWGNRGKLGLGLNLRDPRGAALFRRLVAESDVVLSNFKPGTMESLGFGYEELAGINPGIIVGDSSALGATGPWSRRMGYGPLVRATVGLTALWRHPDRDDGFGDDLTVYPDHAAARVMAFAVLAALVGRRRTGKGTRISVAQAETALGQLATGVLRESLQPGTLVARGATGEFDAPQDIYPCLGEDEWCAVTVDGDDDWRRLCAVIGRKELADHPGYATAAARVAARTEIDAVLGAWTGALPAPEAAERLQAGGIAAGPMLRVNDLLTDPHLVEREFFGELHQPQLSEPLPTERGPARFTHTAEPAPGPAPLFGEHTRQVCRTVLGMTDAEIDELIAAGVLETPDH